MTMYVIDKQLRMLCLLIIGKIALWSSSASESCEYGNDCYFEGSSSPLNWALARQICNQRNSTLPVIRNADQQKRLEEHMKTYSQRYFNIWASGKKVINQGRTWINGKPMTNSAYFTIIENKSDETHFVLDTRQLNTGLLLRALDPRVSAWFICQYNGFRCRDSDSVNLTNSCIKFKGYGNSSWYSASNECSAEGGNLAILEGRDPQLLLRYVQNNASHFSGQGRYSFWTGLLRGTSWQWQLPKEEKGEYVIYSNWQHPLPASGDCISINSAQGFWTISNCNENKTVICQREMDSKDHATTTKKLSEDTSEQTSIHPSLTTSIIVVVIIALFLCVLSNVVVGLIVRKKTLAKRESATTEKHYEVVNRTQMYGNADQIGSTYAALEIQTEYEEVALQTK